MKLFWKLICKEVFYYYIEYVVDDFDLVDELEDDEIVINREIDSKKVKGFKFLYCYYVGKWFVVLYGDYFLIMRLVNCDELNEKFFKCKLNMFI